MPDSFLSVAGFTFVLMLLGAGLLHVFPRMGGAGKALSGWLCRAPGLDLLITYFTAAPMIAGPILAGWAGLGGAVVGQISAVLVWGWLHEAAHPKARRGPRIVTTLNRLFGRARNHLAVWCTALAVPLFWIVRVAQYVIYPPLTVLVRLPKYRDAEWVNVSRQKFDGLVGHDRIWCLYCDWMTGIWSLGSEMLRNVESFWCPIRFSSPEKCANCAVDFPDVTDGWASSSGTMTDVTGILEAKYGPGHAPIARDGKPVSAWFGHPARLTIEGKPPARP